MATKTLNTRFQLKYDTLTNWISANPILLAGEVAVATIETTESASGLTPPAVGIKIGDGTKKFSALNWIQAIAGDVPSWAKEANHTTVDNLIEQAIGNIPPAPSGAGTKTFDSAKLIKSITQDAGGKITSVTYEDITIDSVKNLSTRLSSIDTEIDKKLNANLASSTASTSNLLIDTNAATTLANNAKEGAITTAATDAESKVNAAKTALLGTGGTEGTHTIKGAYDAAANAVNKINALDVADTGAADKFVYEVDQTDGKIAVTRKSLTEIVGVDGTYHKTDNKLATVNTVTTAVNNAKEELNGSIAAMTGAMRFRGTVSAKPTTTTTTPSDNLGAWRAGDVVLFGTAEYVVASLNSSSQPVWQLLGDEGAYQTKLSFTGTYNSTNGKVVTNDTLTNSISGVKTTLLGTGVTEGTDTIASVKTAAANAQTTANNAKDAAATAQADATTALNKINALDVTDAQAGGSGTFVTKVTQTDGKIAVTKKALATADVTNVLNIDGTMSASNMLATQSTINNKIDGLNGSATATAIANNKVSVLTDVTQAKGVISKKTEVQLEAIAKTGNVNDLIQTSGDVLVLFGGTASTVI